MGRLLEGTELEEQNYLLDATFVDFTKNLVQLIT